MYGRAIDINDTKTTNKSSILNKLRQNAPLCIIKPYAITFKHISIVNTDVKK